jgi:hypothetical protein
MMMRRRERRATLRDVRKSQRKKAEVDVGATEARGEAKSERSAVKKADLALVDLALDAGRSDLIDPLRDFLHVLSGNADTETLARVERMMLAREGTMDRNTDGARNARAVLAVEECAQEIAKYRITGNSQFFPLAASHVVAMLARHFPRDADKLKGLDRMLVTSWLLNYTPRRDPKNSAAITANGIAARILVEAGIVGFKATHPSEKEDQIAKVADRLGKNMRRDIGALKRTKQIP